MWTVDALPSYFFIEKAEELTWARQNRRNMKLSEGKPVSEQLTHFGHRNGLIPGKVLRSKLRITIALEELLSG